MIVRLYIHISKVSTSYAAYRIRQAVSTGVHMPRSPSVRPPIAFSPHHLLSSFPSDHDIPSSPALVFLSRASPALVYMQLHGN